MARYILFLSLVLPLLALSCSDGFNVGQDGAESSVADCTSQNLLLSDSLVADSIAVDSAHAIHADSVRIVIEFFDAFGEPMNHPVEIQLEDNFFPDTRMTDRHGTLTYMTHKDHVVYVVYSNDTLITYENMKGGEELTDHLQLNVRPMYGRIMDNNGTPHVNMPVHMHFRSGWKDRTSACGSDVLFTTDSSGYYHTYVPTYFHSIVLRTCGFVFGVIPRAEFESYPKQNFLFDPFEVENRCAYGLPHHEFFLEIPVSEGYDKMSVEAKNWPALFALDQTLEMEESAVVKIVFPHRTSAYKLKKRNGAFYVPKMQVCIR